MDRYATTLNPANKVKYGYGDLVDIAWDGDPTDIRKGKVVGLISEHIIDMWAVELFEFLENWPYKVVALQHTFLRPTGSNRRFLCEHAADE